MEKSGPNRLETTFSELIRKIGKEAEGPTPDQSKVIDSNAKHLLVVAGAGSGKTRTLVYRILGIRYVHKAPPQNILGLTFTVKASRELENRVTDLAETVLREAKRELPPKETENLEACLEPGQGSIRVQTYDAFIQGIVRQSGILIGIDSQTSLLTDAGIWQCIAQVCEDNYDLINRCYSDIAAKYPDFPLPSLTHSADSFSEDLQKSVKNFSGQVLNFLVDEDHLDFNSALNGVKDWNSEWLESLNGLLQKQKEAVDQLLVQQGEKVSEGERLTKEEKNKLNQEETTVKNIETLICKARLRELVIELSEKYSEAKQKENLAEFGDFTLYALKLLKVRPGIAQDYRDKYKYVFLDEYQDTNHTQGLLLKALFGEGDSTCVTAVGDPQQSIYGFRGSAPGAFKYFRDNFGVSKAQGNELSLPTTFRNKKKVVNLANCITGLHLDQKEQQDLKPNPGKANGEEICALAYKDGKEEIQGPRAVLEFVQRENYQENRVAVLGRDNDDLPPYKDWLEENGVPCMLTGKAAFDDKNPIARDLKYFLSACSDPFAVWETEYLLTSPRYGLSMEGLRVLAKKVNTKNERLNRPLGHDSEPGRSETEGNPAHPEPLITLPLYLDLYLEDDLKYDKKLEELRRSGESKILERFKANMDAVKSAAAEGVEAAVSAAWGVLDFNADIGIAEELLGRLPYEKLTLADALEAARSYESDLAANRTPSLQGFLLWLSNYKKDRDQKVSGKDGIVELMTIHQAKGLEWDAVAVVGMEKVSKRGQELSFREEGFLGKGDRFWKRTWINSYSEIPQNKRADLSDCDESYRKACRAFDDLSGLSAKELSKRIDDLCHAEIRHDEVEEAHTAYVAMTRTKGDLLLVSRITGNSDFKVDNLRKTTCTGMFWVDAVNFILEGKCCANADEAEEEKWGRGLAASSTKDHGFALYSTGERLKKALESQLKLSIEAPEEEEYEWPLQIKKAFRDVLGKSRDFVVLISKQPESEWGSGKLLSKAQSLLRLSEFQNGRSVERTKSLSGTGLQELMSNPDKELDSIFRPMPHLSKKAAETGTEFHEWAAEQLDPSKAEQCKIDSKNEDEIAGWQEVFLASEWPSREVYSVEKAYTVQVPGISDPITAKMDAVFKGDLGGGKLSSKLTIVDWKTGKVPKDGKEIDEKRLQLDIYRLVLSRALNKDISDIDACLYYVSARNGENPQIDAEDKSEDEILEAIVTSKGLCARSNDEQENE